MVFTFILLISKHNCALDYIIYFYTLTICVSQHGIKKEN
jgi:hypothetical protein